MWRLDLPWWFDQVATRFVDIKACCDVASDPYDGETGRPAPAAQLTHPARSGWSVPTQDFGRSKPLKDRFRATSLGLSWAPLGQQEPSANGGFRVVPRSWCPYARDIGECPARKTQFLMRDVSMPNEADP